MNEENARQELSFEDMLRDPNEQFDLRSELLASIDRYMNAPSATMSAPPAASPPCPHGWRDARCGRFGERGPCGCEPPTRPTSAAATGFHAALQREWRERQTIYEAHEWTGGDDDEEHCARCFVTWADADERCARPTSAGLPGDDRGGQGR